MDNLTIQADEIEALVSIYGSDWKIDGDIQGSYSISVTEEPHEVTVHLTLPADYPTCLPPNVQLFAPTLSTEHKQRIALALDDIYLENLGEPLIYQWIEKIREHLQGIPKIVHAPPETVNPTTPKRSASPVIHHGGVIQDRKSIFQGHVAEIHSVSDVSIIMEALLENKKIADATHNMSAYRIRVDSGKLTQDYDDDGEALGGRRLLHLLQILDVSNVVVVVTRWYGGVHLGPDRFRHINNAARQILEQTGYIVKKC